MIVEGQGKDSIGGKGVMLLFAYDAITRYQGEVWVSLVFFSEFKCLPRPAVFYLRRGERDIDALEHE